MLSLKQALVESLPDISDDVTAEELVYRIYTLDNIRKGLEDVKAGRIIDQDELEKEAQKC